jgi:hypothetical protein
MRVDSVLCQSEGVGSSPPSAKSEDNERDFRFMGILLVSNHNGKVIRGIPNCGVLSFAISYLSNQLIGN